jgi:hypothetical protein
MMVARLATGLLEPHPLPAEARRLRASGVRGWLTALAVPTKLRAALQQALTVSAGEDRVAMAEALESVGELTAAHMDRAARVEYARLVAGLKASQPPLAVPERRAVE